MKWTLKIKIILGLSILLVLTIMFNLFYSYQVIVKDKTAYIFENGLDKVETLADQTIETVQKQLGKSTAYILLAEKSAQDFKNLLNADSDLLFFAYRYNETDEWKFFTSTRQLDSGISYGQEVRKIFIDSAGVVDKIAYKAHNLKGVPVLSLHAKAQSGEVFYIFELTKLRSLFREDNVFQNHLTTLNMNNLIDPDQPVPDYVKELAKAKNNKGTKVIKTESGNLLASFTKFPSLGIFVAGTISQGKAFTVTKELVLRSVFFGMILLGFSMIAGLFFSHHLTSPINSLMDATQWIAAGEFDKKINISSNDEMKVLGESFNFMSGEINSLLEQKQDMIKKLEDYSKNLEKMVDERTAELKSANDFIGAMLNSLDQGLLVFDKDLKCNDIYTQACEEMFEVSPKGNDYGKVLGKDEKEVEALRKWAELLFSDKLPFEAASNLGPTKLIIGNDAHEENFKHISLAYYPMNNADDVLENVMVVATDKTEEVKAIEAFNDKEAYVEMILKLVHSRKNFMNFIDDTEGIIDELGVSLNQDPPNITQAMLLYHSLNGGFGMYSVAPLQKLARSCEQRISDIKEGRTDLTSERVNLLFDFDNFVENYKSFLSEIDRLISSSKGKVEMDKAMVKEIGDKIRHCGNIKEIREMYRDYIEREAVGDHFAKYKELVEELSIRLKKPMMPIKFKNADLRINPDEHKEFITSLVHLFRNCMDHGIEKEEIRKERHKSLDGQISVSFAYEDSGESKTLHFQISDDGGGINPDIIRAKLTEKRPDLDVDQISDDQMIYHIFDADFSTAQEVTSVSGRGVGMSAIKDVVEKKGGRLSITTEVGKGTTFDFWLPTT